MDKDKSIVIQVAAKIAADLTPKNENTETMLGDFAVLFDGVKGILVDEIFGNEPVTAQAQPAAQRIMEEFNARPVTADDIASVVKVRGEQHGDLPGWLMTACARAGVTEVYDNRDGLSANPKRPWFKAVNNKELAFWPPKGK
jgi:hypothetical protein